MPDQQMAKALLFVPAGGAGEWLDMAKSHLSVYTRKDGAFVGEHDDKRVAHAVGDSVKVTGQGKTGVIHDTAPSGKFHTVKHSDGSDLSYQASDLFAHKLDDEDDDRR